MEEHIRIIHERRKDFKCEFCAVSTSTSYGLKSHINAIHKKLKKYKCDSCEKMFMNLSNMKKHASSVHINSVSIHVLL